MTRDDLLAYDDRPTMRGEHERFLCPKCGGDHSRDQMHQSLSLKDGYFLCHRCGFRGVLEEHGRAARAERPKTTRATLKDRFAIN